MQKTFTGLSPHPEIGDDLSSLAATIASLAITEGFTIRTAGPPSGSPIFERVALEQRYQKIEIFVPNHAAGNDAAYAFHKLHDPEYWVDGSKPNVRWIRAHYGLALAGPRFDQPSKFLLHVDFADDHQKAAIRMAQSLEIPCFDLAKPYALELFNEFWENL